MGLTISYTLSTRRKLDHAAVRTLVQTLRTAAVRTGAVSVSHLFEVGPDFVGAFHWPRRATKISDLVSPQEGWLFTVDPGQGAESCLFGLCRYAGVAGWRLRSFCKTQYAARYGWDHFRHCHRRVIELLWAAEEHGLRVVVNDEGGLWEHGSEMTLRRRLAEYDRAVAALGGALKDAADSMGHRVHGAIFDDPRFEQLEAEGRQEHESRIPHVRGSSRMGEPNGEDHF
jgi:hypothetical protein